MFEDNISWPTDISSRFQQIDGFVSSIINTSSSSLNLPSCEEVFGSSNYNNCKQYTDKLTNNTYYYWYPNDDNIQYLYESYPNIISPLEGVTNEHFINWMRTAGLPHFRKLYGRINSDIIAGDIYIFDIQTNFEVVSITGSKAIVLTTLADYGGQNFNLGKSGIIIGTVSLCVGFLFAIKRIFYPRPLGDIRHLNWNN